MNARDKDGKPLADEHVLGSLRLLLIAGIDTTWSAIGSSLWHLAKTPADRERLVAEPELMPLAVEELLRAYSPVTMAREVMKETTISGCPVKPGNMVLLSFPAANRDPAMFPDADKVVIDRKENRHAAFGLGIHRCVGSNLARMEMTVAIEEWLKRIPDFRLDPAGKVTWSEGTVRGPRQLPVLFGKARLSVALRWGSDERGQGRIAMLGPPIAVQLRRGAAPLLLDLDLRVARDFLPGFDVARIDVALLISGDEVGRDAERQQLLGDVGLGQRLLQRGGNFLRNGSRNARGRIHHPGQAPFEIDALLLVARNVRQARGSSPADRKRLQLAILHQRRPGRHVDQPHRDVPAHQVVGEFRRAAERDMLQADARLLGEDFAAEMSGRADAPASVLDRVALLR